jgi:signal transduction histidine kinase
VRRHPRLTDGVLAFALLTLGGSSIRFHPAAGEAGTHARLYALLSIPFVLAMTLPVVVRRKHPVGAFAAVIVTGALELVWLPNPVGSDLAVLIVLYTLAAYRPRRESVIGLFICLAGAAIAIAKWWPVSHNARPQGIAVVAAAFVLPVLFAWLLGDSMRYRRGYYQALEERAARLEAERDAQAQVAAAAERARIARELHDVVAHNVSVMVVQADGAGYALDADPERARQAVAAVARTGREALTEMRRLLGVLRTSDEPGSLEPLPDLARVEDLLNSARAAGMTVTLVIEGVPRVLPGGAGLAAYRVVQEALTNVRKHAGPGAKAAVTIRYEENQMLMRVTDDGRGAATAVHADGAPPYDGLGHGLAGMRERMDMYGGTVLAGPRHGGGYQVTVRLPYEGTVAAA